MNQTVTVTIWSWSECVCFQHPDMSPNLPLLSALAFVPSLPFSYNSFFEGHHWHLGIFQEVQGLKEKPCWILLKCTQFCKYLSSGHLPYFYPPPALLFPFSTISWLSLPFPPSLECCQPRLCLLTSHHDCHIFLAGSIYVPLNPVSRSASGDEEERESACDICQISTMPPSRICHTAPRAFVWLTWEPFSPLPWLPTLSAGTI